MWDCSKEGKKTRVIDDNLNPLFYETLELDIEAESADLLPPFILDVWDKDFGSEGDFLARCMIPIQDSAHVFDKKKKTTEKPPRPQWHGCKLSPGSPDCGQILVSFSIVDSDFNYQVPLNYMSLKKEVPTDDFIISMNILGLRDL